MQHVAIEKQDGLQGLILSRCGDVPLFRKEGQKSGQVLFRKFIGMPFIVKNDEPIDPVEVGFFRAVGEMPQSNDITNLFEKGDFFILCMQLGG